MLASPYRPYPGYASYNSYSDTGSEPATRFKEQVLSLCNEISVCDNLIRGIKYERHLPPHPKNLHHLQEGLVDSRGEIEAKYHGWRRRVGSRIESGDAVSQIALSDAMRDLRGVQRELELIASSRAPGHKRERGRFRDLWDHWKDVHYRIVKAIDELGRTLESPYYSLPGASTAFGSPSWRLADPNPIPAQYVPASLAYLPARGILASPASTYPQALSTYRPAPAGEPYPAQYMAAPRYAAFASGPPRGLAHAEDVPYYVSASYVPAPPSREPARRESPRRTSPRRTSHRRVSHRRTSPPRESSRRTPPRRESPRRISPRREPTR